MTVVKGEGLSLSELKWASKGSDSPNQDPVGVCRDPIMHSVCVCVCVFVCVFVCLCGFVFVYESGLCVSEIHMW